MVSFDSAGVDWSQHVEEEEGKPATIALVAAEKVQTVAAEKVQTVAAEEIQTVAAEVQIPSEIALMGISPHVNNCVFGCYTNYADLKEEYEKMKDELNTYYIDNQAYKKSLKLLEKQKAWFQKNE